LQGRKSWHFLAFVLLSPAACHTDRLLTHRYGVILMAITSPACVYYARVQFQNRTIFTGQRARFTKLTGAPNLAIRRCRDVRFIMRSSPGGGRLGF
jgi:hypothetical protein